MPASQTDTLELPRLMAITPGTLTDQGADLEALCNKLQRLSSAGVQLFQFREKQLDAGAAHVALLRCRQSTAEDAIWLVNGGVCGAPDFLTDGFHYPATHPRPQHLPDRIHGRSVHSEEALQNAASEGAHYVTASPVYPPSTKPVSGRGTRWLQMLCRQAPMPVYALGGVSPERTGPCLAAGAHGVAVLSGLMHALDPASAAHAYLQALQKAS